MIKNFKENIFNYSSIDGVLQVIRQQVNVVIDPSIKNIFDSFIKFFELENINELTISNVKNNEKVLEILQRIDLFCEEVAQISNQNEIFIKYIFNTLIEFQNTEEKAKTEQIIKNNINQFSMNKRVLELLGQFVHYEKIFLVNNKLIKTNKL